MNTKIRCMELALLQAQLAFDQDEVPVGSVIIKDSKIIAKEL